MEGAGPQTPTADVPAAAVAGDSEAVEGLTAQEQKLMRWAAANNIADDLDDDKLNEIGNKVEQEYKIDDETRDGWVKKTKAAMDLAMQVAKEKTYPWPKASNVIFPLMTTAAMQFAARAYPAIINGRNVVQGIVVGDDNGTPVMSPQGPVVDPQSGQPAWQVPPGAKRERAIRIGEHMSWQLLDEMKEWEEETDQLLHILPIVGCVFRKSYFDPGKGRNVSCMVTAFNVVINYHAKGMDITPRITEEVKFYPVEITEMERAGTFRKIDYVSEPTAGIDPDAPREFLEQHRYLDLDDDGMPEPYIVTIHKATRKVVRIRARYEPEGVILDGKGKISRIIPVQYYTKYDFLPNPDGGIYGIGFGQLLGPINEAINTTLNQILDAGHLSNTGGGFIGKGFSMNTGAVRFAPGEYKVVNVSGAAIKDSIVPLTFPGPSNVLFNMLGLLIDAGKDIASVKDVMMGEQQQHNVPATTTLALIEQGMKVFTGIYKRVYRAMESELDKLFHLNSLYLPEAGQYRVGDVWKTITRADYLEASGVEPISDPAMVSDMQRMARAQFLMQFGNDPMFNGMEIRKRVLDAANIDRPHELIVDQPPQNPELIIKNDELTIKKMEVEIERKRQEAAQLKDLAQSVLFFAQADAVAGNMHLAWVQQQLEGWRAQFEAASATMPQGGGGPEGAPPPTIPDEMKVPTPDHPAPGPDGPLAATPGVAQGDLPPGAQQAPDGNHYLPDPNRPGKYLQVVQ